RYPRRRVELGRCGWFFRLESGNRSGSVRPRPIIPVILTIRPRRAYPFATRFPAKLICEGETHGFETIWSKKIPERQRRVGRRFVGSSGTRDRPNTGIPTN